MARGYFTAGETNSEELRCAELCIWSGTEVRGPLSLSLPHSMLLCDVLCWADDNVL